MAETAGILTVPAGRALRSVRAFAARIDAATPVERDRAVDALRAFAIGGVVLGHWLVTAIIQGSDGRLHGDSPLHHLPVFTPLSWLFQTLAVFFLVGGHVAARSWESARARGTSYGRWLGRRLARLSRPVASVLAVWAVITGWLTAGDAGWDTVYTLVHLIVSPLWFLGVFVLLTAATPLVAMAVRARGAWAAALPVVTVAAVDLARFGHAAPERLGWVNVLAGWLVPYCLGAAWAGGAFKGWRAPLTLLVGGALAAAALIVWCGYPASMVGVPGEAVSNLNPPTLVAVSFGLAQTGLALLAREPLRRAMRRPLAWAAVAMVNLTAMTVFLWHQTAMLLTTSVGLAVGHLPGLHTPPDTPLWAAERLAWLPLFALVLVGLVLAFRHLEHGRPRSRRTTP
ncbi:acyltransferase family protein [Streptomyces sp. URMC 123]|uniref:acyltransferase family protein n=1 Tax=Streptomyces sp. URMC 123 TaxID=3423403 RepID=UPI003F1C6B18